MASNFNCLELVSPLDHPANGIAKLKLPESERGNVEFVVPTGNFGNVLAGWMAQRMGLPCESFRVATNQNDILHKLFETGVYEVGDVAPSLAPSIDIQVASNFERFIYFAEGRDPTKVRAIMKQFKESGHYTFEAFNRDTFTSSKVTDAEIPQIIKIIHEKYGYIADPHTACAFADFLPGNEQAGQGKTQIFLATASPAKFPETIIEAIGTEPLADALEELKQKEIVTNKMPADLEAVKQFMLERAV